MAGGCICDWPEALWLWLRSHAKLQEHASTPTSIYFTILCIIKGRDGSSKRKECQVVLEAFVHESALPSVVPHRRRLGTTIAPRYVTK